MTIVRKEMTNEELIAIRNEVDKILKERQEKIRANAMNNFRKAFEEMRELCQEIYVTDDDDEISVDDFEDFYFTY